MAQDCVYQALLHNNWANQSVLAGLAAADQKNLLVRKLRYLTMSCNVMFR